MTNKASSKTYDPTRTAIQNRIQLGEGTTFLPGKKDLKITHLIDHVLKHGYVILPNIFTPSQVSTANSELSRLRSIGSGPASKGGRNPFEGWKTERIYALPDKSRAFDCFALHPTVLALNDYFLQVNYQLNGIASVFINPGQEVQKMHTDDGLIALPRPRPLMGVGTIVVLDEFTSSNGATTLIPDSHLWPESRQPKREEMISAIMPAGSMVYYLNTIWHGGGANASDKPRRAITVQYCQPWLRSYENMTVAMGWENLDAVPQRLLDMMGFSLHGFIGYVDGRSPRQGVEMRKKRLIEWGLKEREKRDKSKL